MDVTTGFFYFFSAVLLFASFRVITARNPVHAVLFLILAFAQAAGLWLLLKAEFLALTLVLVYLGAVMVLFLFVVMMLDIRFDGIRKGFWRNFPLAATVGAIIALEMITVLMGGFRITEPVAHEVSAQIPASVLGSNSKMLGYLLYTRYLYPIQVAAVILLVAMIAAIALALRQRKDSKRVDASMQVRARAAGRMSLVKMPATQAASAPVEPAAAVEVKP